VHYYQILVSAKLGPHDQNPLVSSTMENINYFQNTLSQKRQPLYSCP